MDRVHRKSSLPRFSGIIGASRPSNVSELTQTNEAACPLTSAWTALLERSKEGSDAQKPHH